MLSSYTTYLHSLCPQIATPPSEVSVRGLIVATSDFGKFWLLDWIGNCLNLVGNFETWSS